MCTLVDPVQGQPLCEVTGNHTLTEHLQTRVPKLEKVTSQVALLCPDIPTSRKNILFHILLLTKTPQNTLLYFPSSHQHWNTLVLSKYSASLNHLNIYCINNLWILSKFFKIWAFTNNKNKISLKLKKIIVLFYNLLTRNFFSSSKIYILSLRSSWCFQMSLMGRFLTGSFRSWIGKDITLQSWKADWFHLRNRGDGFGTHCLLVFAPEVATSCCSIWMWCLKGPLEPSSMFSEEWKKSSGSVEASLCNQVLALMVGLLKKPQLLVFNLNPDTLVLKDGFRWFILLSMLLGYVISVRFLKTVLFFIDIIVMKQYFYLILHFRNAYEIRNEISPQQQTI